jgi:hypothetical protein
MTILPFKRRKDLEDSNFFLQPLFYTERDSRIGFIQEPILESRAVYFVKKAFPKLAASSTMGGCFGS